MTSTTSTIASSSVSYDLHAKLNVYRRNAIPEYVVWRVLNRAIDWFILREGQYRPIATDAQGLYRSEVFPGLRLDPAALIARDTRRLRDVVDRGLATADHRAFVAALDAGRP